MNKEKTITGYAGTTSRFEKLAYALGDFGTNFVWTFASSFLTLYYTDSVLISAGVIGTLMLVARLLDGVSDILFGMIMERVHLKSGKTRPWFGLSIIPLVISFLLMFNVPAILNSNIKLIYVIVTYILLTVIVFTVNNLSYLSMLSRISLDADDRNQISSIRAVFASTASLGLAVGTPLLLNICGGEKMQSSWTIISVVYGTICLVTQGICYFGTSEKIPAESGGEKVENNIWEGIRELFHTKYFFIAIGMFVVGYIQSGSLLGGSVYYARDVLGDSNLYAVCAVAIIIPTIIGNILTPKITNVLGKRKTMMYGAVAGVVGSVIAAVFAANLPIVLILFAVTSFCGAPIGALQFTLAPDIVDYLADKTGSRWEGLVTSANSFGMKVGTGLGSAILGWALAIGHYDGALAVQPQSALMAEIALVFVIPAITSFIKVILINGWDLSDK